MIQCNEQPYTNAYKIDALQTDLNDPQRDELFFLSDQPVLIEIIDHEREPSLANILHTTIYTINIRHCHFKWQVKRKYKNFLKLYEAYALFKTKQNIRNTAHHIIESSTTSVSTHTKFNTSDHFKLFFQSIVSDFVHSKHILEKFLQDVVDNKLFRNHSETLKFLEVSHLSFITHLGDKLKEGLVCKHVFSIRFCSSASSSLNFFSSTRWLIIKDSWIAYLDPKTGEIRQVILVDKAFRVTSGLENTGERSGLLVHNMSKTLFLKCLNEKRAHEWRYAIQHMLSSTGREFCPREGTRYESYAPIRYSWPTKWFIDGADYMNAIADSINAAKEEIFIAGFFLSPEIYLKRPVLMGDKWRLDKLLKYKADQGVKIFILIYKEIEITLPINSAYSKRTLSHKNIKVLRHPDHLNGPIMWAHHEKLVIIDQEIAYFGGIDLCYGRWDDHNHRLTDLGSVLVTKQSQTNMLNKRQSDENNNNLLERNDSKADILPEIEDKSLKLRLNKKLRTIRILSVPNASEESRRASRNFLIDNMTDYYYNFIKDDLNENKPSRIERLFNRVEQLKRSKSLELTTIDSSQDDSSSEHLTHSLKYLDDTNEYSLLNKFRRLKQIKENLKKYKINTEVIRDNENENETTNEVDSVDLDNLQGSTKLWIGKDYCNFIFKDVKNVHSPFQDSINRATTPRMPWHDIAGCVHGAPARDISRHFIERWNYIKQKKAKNNKAYFYLLPKSYDSIRPNVNLNDYSTCNVQSLRSVSNWSAGISKTESSIHKAMINLIKMSKHYIYIENQFFISCVHDDLPVKNEIALALYDRIMRAVNEKENFKVYVFLPLIPGYEGEYGKLKSSGVLLHTITHYNNATINGLIKKLTDASIDPFNYIFFFGLRTWSELNEKLITEIIYVHSKLMIVDDKYCLIGSANINDRSLLGSRDSEVALLIEDTQFKMGILNKKQIQVGVFASSLRKRLFKEFLGELQTNNSTDLVSDPCSDEFYKQVLLKQASQNTRIYDLVFKVIPCDYINNFEQLRDYQKTMGLNQTDVNKAKEEMKKVKGYVVIYPNRFLVNQDLTPPLGTKEKLLPNILWT